MEITLTAVLVVSAVGTLFWGFERYRTRFAKTDLLIAVGGAVGLLTIVFVPVIYDQIGDALDIRQRFVTVSLLGNIALFSCVLYLVSLVRNNRSRINDLTRSLSLDQANPVKADGGGNTIGVVIPAYNEEQTIQRVVEALPETIRATSSSQSWFRMGRPMRPPVVLDPMV